MVKQPDPTDRELEILKILWEKGEASVRTVYEEMSKTEAIVQNTVQAFLRIMEEKGLVKHRVKGRSFIYTAKLKRDRANRQLMSRILQRVFDGSIDQLVQSAITAQNPSEEELRQLEVLIRQAKQKKNRGDHE